MTQNKLIKVYNEKYQRANYLRDFRSHAKKEYNLEVSPGNTLKKKNSHENVENE